MVLYKVMVVDEEEELCKEMIKKIPWKALGFEIVGTAGNGLKALDCLKKQQPEVMITDIHMPFMNGIDFLEQALKSVPRTKTIVLSHCDEFEYAQKAISLHVFDYILKPFSFNRLIEALSQLRKSLDDEREEEQKNKKLSQRYEEMLPTLKENFLINCLTGNLTAEVDQEKAESLNIGFESALYIVGLICIKQSGNYRTNPTSYFEKKKGLLTVKRVAEQILSQFYSIETG